MLFRSEAENGIKVMSVNLLLPKDDEPVIWRGPILANMVKQFWTDVVWGEIPLVDLIKKRLPGWKAQPIKKCLSGRKFPTDKKVPPLSGRHLR